MDRPSTSSSWSSTKDSLSNDENESPPTYFYHMAGLGHFDAEGGHERRKSEAIVEEIVFPDDTVRRRKLILSIDDPPKPAHFIRASSGETVPVPQEKVEAERKHSKHQRFAPDVPDEEKEENGPSPFGEKAHKAHSVFIPREVRHQPWYHIHMEVAIPFLIAGVGMVVAGYLLDVFSCYPAFLHIRELIVIPRLAYNFLGSFLKNRLKGTMEMMLAARLCTHVNLGHMDSCYKRIKAAMDDMLLSQLQAILCGLISAILAMVIVQIEHTAEELPAPVLNRIIVVWAISILTAMTASLIIGSTVILIVFSTDKCDVNPDNIATPIIACLGDVLTLVLLSFWGDKFYVYLEHSKPQDVLGEVTTPLVIVALILFVVFPVMLFIAWKDDSSKAMLKSTWLPVLFGVVISTAAGSILEKEGMRYTNMNFYQPVINFVGGNLASIQYNRISTAYCRDTELGTLPKLAHGRPNKVCHNPYGAARSQGIRKSLKLNLEVCSLADPGEFRLADILFDPDAYFGLLRVISEHLFLVGFVQTAFLMYITLILTNFLWSRKHDPDSYVIPFVTATSDLIGTSFLFFICYLVYGTNEDSKAGHDPNPQEHLRCRH